MDGNYSLLWLGEDFPKKSLEELKSSCKNIEKNYYKRDCEIEGGRDESLYIFKNNFLHYYFHSRGYSIRVKDYSKKFAIDASILCRQLIKLSGKTKSVSTTRAGS
jgi:hypothetical protein